MITLRDLPRATALLVGLLLPLGATAVDPMHATAEVGGVVIEVGLQPLDVADGPELAMGSIAVRDSASGRAYGGARPMAWIVARRGAYGSGELSCESRAKRLASGSLGVRADIDLNAYRIVTMNHDRSVTFINPFVALNNAKLESIVSLPGDGVDWVYSAALQRLFVSLRDLDQVAVIDTASRRLLPSITFRAGEQPTRLLLDETRRVLWVGLDRQAHVAAVGLASLAGEAQPHIERVPAGAGLHTLAMSSDRQWLFAINATTDTVSVIDTGSRQRTTEVPVRGTPLVAAWSEPARRLVVATANEAGLTLLDPVSGRVSSRITLPYPAQALALLNGGRHALVTARDESMATLIDLATGTTVASSSVTANPDQIVISRGFAYVRGQASSNVSVINLRDALQGRMSVAHVPMGRQAPDAAMGDIGIAAMMAPSPEGNGVVVANAPDGVIYRYTEGLMVPSGNFSNYRRRARALMVLDSGLTELEAGVYSAPVRFTAGGSYEMVVQATSPLAAACFPIEVALPETPTAKLAVGTRAVLLRAGMEPDGIRQAFTIGLQGPGQVPHGVAADASLLVFQPTTGWQQRIALIAREPGVYEAAARLPRAGRYELMVGVPSLELGYVAGRVGSVEIDASGKPAVGEHHARQD